MNYKKELGNYGENLAKDYLEKNHYQILAKNWHCRFGEIDLIALDEKFLVFVEVKTRSNRKFGPGIEAINFFKVKKIYKSAQTFIQKNQEFNNTIWRVDAIVLEKNNQTFSIEHVKNITLD